MTAFVFLPIYLLTFWFGQAPIRLLWYFHEVNKAFFQFFSVPLLVKTFFKPVKNEYRKGLVGFSIGMGIVLKSCILFVSFFLFLPLLLIELVLFIGFMAFPVITLALLLW